MQSPRSRTLILGADYTTFHLYWRYYSQVQDQEIVGFIYCGEDELPVQYFKGIYKTPHRIHPLNNLYHLIKTKRIQRCVIQAQNLSIPKVQSIIHIILSTGTCSFEFLPKTSLVVRSFKPIITISSLAPKLGKSQLARYFCTVLSREHRRVAIIYPLAEIIKPENSNVLNIDSCPFYEFNQGDEIPSDVFSLDDESLLKSYQGCGAYKIFATADTRHAIICAEQSADVIIFDANSCELPYIKAKANFCVVSEESLKKVRQKSLWPGIVNVMDSENIVLLSRSLKKLDDKQRRAYENLFKEQTVYFAFSQTIFEDSSGAEVFNKKVLTVDHNDDDKISTEAAQSMGASEIVIPPQVTSDNSVESRGKRLVARLPRALSPNPDIKKQTENTFDTLAKVINKSDADVVIISLNHQIPNVDTTNKTILYTSPEILDDDSSLYNWLSQFFQQSKQPPLKNHFEAQVDIIMALAHASDKELFVTNNDSANREAFCRLFLQGHLPPGFRVTTGEIIDCYSNLTGQLDVIIVNDVCPRMTIDTTNSVIAPVPADSVLGVIEVKTTLTQDALKKALSQMRPVKALMPAHTTLQLPDGRIVEDPLGGKIIAGIFSFNPATEIEDKVPEILEMYPNVVDFIVLPDSFGFFSKRTLEVCGMSIGGHETYNGYVKFSSKGMGLALIYGILNSLAAIRRFSGLNCVRYLSGNWGGKQDMIQKNIVEVKSKINGLSKYVVNMGQETKADFFRFKNQLYKNVDKLANLESKDKSNEDK